MKVLELGKFYPPERGGIETLLQIWAEGLSRLGAQVECVVANRTRKSTTEHVQGVRVHRMGSYGTCMSTSLSPSYLMAPRRLEADIWHAHFPNPLADLAVLLGPKKVPLVVHWHSDIIRQRQFLKIYGGLIRAVLRRADRIVVATPQHLEFSPWLQPFQEKVNVITFGLNLDRFNRLDPGSVGVQSLRARAGGRTILLNIGRLVGYKGQRYAIEALKGLDAELWLVGTGPLEGELRQLASELGVGSQVVFWGDADDEELAKLLHAADIFVFPSVTPNEAFGLVLVEAMACGKPLVACHLRSGVPFVCQDQVNGLLVPPEDSEALRDVLSTLIQSPELRHRLGETGRARAKNEFCQSKMVDATWDLFNKLTKEL